MAKDPCVMKLGECPDDIHPRALGCHGYFACLRVHAADAVHQDLVRKNAEVIAPIEDKPWGMRGFALRRVDGQRITIGHSLMDRAGG